MFEKIFSFPFIAVVGLGKEGYSTISWLRRKGYGGKIVVADLIEKDIPDGVDHVCFGENYLYEVSKYPIIFRAPGIPLGKLLKAGCLMNSITSQTSFILKNCRVIGVTGTKGKSTTATLITHILKKANIPCHLAGNIGNPFFDLPDEALNELIVAEFSSHQLLDIHDSPHISVLLNIEPEHLDYYDSFDSYVQAKMNIILYQRKNDILVTSPDYIHGHQAIINARGKIITFGKSVDNNFVINGNEIVYKDDAIINTSFLRGPHNVDNVAAAIAACSSVGIAAKNAAILAKDYIHLPYRLETISITEGIEFIDDPLATTPEALIKAIDTFKGKIGALICGGSERHQDYTNAVHAIIQSGAKLVVAFPSTGERIASQIDAYAKNNGQMTPKIIFTTSMEDAVLAVYNICSPGDVCLHSPGAPSFDNFKNYQEKSQAYRDAISALKDRP